MKKEERAEPSTKTTICTNKKTSAEPAPAKPPSTKMALLQARLQQDNGASLKQLEQEFGWLPHTVRAAISGLRKGGFVVQREASAKSSAYRIVGSRVA